MNSEDGGVETFSLAHCLYRLLYSLEMLAGWLVVLPASWWHVLCSGWWWCRWIRRWAFSSPPTIRRRTSDGVVAENSLLLILCLLLLRLLMLLLLLLSTPSHHHHYYYPNNSIYAKSLWARKYENTTIMKSLWPTTTNFLLSSSFGPAFGSFFFEQASERTTEFLAGGDGLVGCSLTQLCPIFPPFSVSLSPHCNNIRVPLICVPFNDLCISLSMFYLLTIHQAASPLSLFHFCHIAQPPG